MVLGECGEEEVMAPQPAPAMVAGGQGACSAQRTPLLTQGHCLWGRGAWTEAAISQNAAAGGDSAVTRPCQALKSEMWASGKKS